MFVASRSRIRSQTLNVSLNGRSTLHWLAGLIDMTRVAGPRDVCANHTSDVTPIITDQLEIHAKGPEQIDCCTVEKS
jgi:hypothetical protein